MIWRRRYAMLGNELLRPTDRRGFVRELFWAIGRDLMPLVVLHLVLAGVVVALVVPWGLPPWFIPVALSYCLFHGLVIYVTTIVLLSVRSELTCSILLGLGFIAMFIASQQVPAAILNPESWHPGWAMAMFTAGSILAAACVLGLKHYWVDLELA